jgi:hypothetical protein
MRSEGQLLANKSTRRSRGLLFDNNNWSSDRIIYGCLSSLAKNLPILKFCTRGIRLIISWIEWKQTHYCQSFLFKIIYLKKSSYRHFLSDYCSVHFREILSSYFLFSRFDWSIFVKQLVAKHMKEIIVIKFMVFFSDIINIKKKKNSLYSGFKYKSVFTIYFHLIKSC